MTEISSPPGAPGPQALPAPEQARSPAVAPPAAAPGSWLVPAGLLLLALVASASLMLAWTSRDRVERLQVELASRQAEAAQAAAEARALSRAAETTAREAGAKIALLDARVAETALQRSQLEDLIQSMARSRDENVLADVEAAVRVAVQQTAITGGAQVLVAALRQADERLARYNQPRLERVRRAIAQDIERTRNSGMADTWELTLRLDEVARQVDDLPLVTAAVAPPGAAASAALARTAPRRGAAGAVGAVPGSAAPSPAASGAAEAATAGALIGGWVARARAGWEGLRADVVQELRGLVRVNRIDAPQSILIAPDQAYFLRENLKLRLLNARLALMSRQFEIAQADLREAQAALDRYFERSARRQAVQDVLRQVQAQARGTAVPRPDATLAAITTALAGR